jgi:hypothetical protein
MEIEEMGNQEVAEGLTRLAASEAMAERSDELAAAGVLLGVEGAAKVETAAAAAGIARELGAAGVAEVAAGAAVLGAAATAEAASDA